jgi:hypothetical protein
LAHQDGDKMPVNISLHPGELEMFADEKKRMLT